jgi:hypothetical protein
MDLEPNLGVELGSFPSLPWLRQKLIYICLLSSIGKIGSRIWLRDSLSQGTTGTTAD